jgi:phage terminase large subunit
VQQTVDTGYVARSQFLPLHARIQRWAIAVCHRRAGKTVACINDLVDGALRCQLPSPRFAYVAPFYSQAKDIAWNYLRNYTLPIPGAKPFEYELRIDLPNEGRVRLYGADNYERLRGSYYDGIVLDEFGDMDPRAWQEVIRPALSDRHGWAIFIGTPKGRNHFYDLWRQAQNDPEWFRLMLKASQSGLIDGAELADARKAMTEDQYNAEYECSFEAAIVGAYYAREIEQAERDKRICSVPYEARVPVETAWDLGVGDSTSIWFLQQVGKEIRVIDYLENHGVGMGWYANELRQKPYSYGLHILPHDAEARMQGEEVRTRAGILKDLGFANQKIIAASNVDDGINVARVMFSRCWFDKTKCEQGLRALRQYHREWDDKHKVFHPRPMHDWSSHAADAFRMAALGLPEAQAEMKPIQYPRVQYV